MASEDKTGQALVHTAVLCPLIKVPVVLFAKVPASTPQDMKEVGGTRGSLAEIKAAPAQVPIAIQIIPANVAVTVMLDSATLTNGQNNWLNVLADRTAAPTKNFDLINNNRVDTKTCTNGSKTENGTMPVKVERELQDQEDGSIFFVNAKQYKRILIRRVQRQKLQEKGKIPLSSVRQKYLYESRHRHATRRNRGVGGRFVPKSQTDPDA